MLIKLTLTNFKKHESLVIDFTSGLVAIRGLNEAGKSTVYQAVAYAFYGSRALPDSVDNTVTWGKAPSTLKVELSFSHDNVEYTLVRSKSGAKLTSKEKESQGQAEVTAVIEKLFGLPQATASKVMIANQYGLRGALDEGSGAIKLIEQLSEVDLIDQLIQAVQEKLPSGNTSSIEQTIATLQMYEKPVADFSAEQAACDKLSQDKRVVDRDIDLLNERISRLDTVQATELINKAKYVEGQRTQLLTTKANYEAELAKPRPAVHAVNIDELRQKWQEQKDAVKIHSAYANYLKIQSVAVEYDKTTAQFDTFIQDLERQKESTVNSSSQLLLSIAEIKAKKITLAACEFCGKDFKDVPEVAEANALIDSKLVELDARLQSTQGLLKSLTEQLAKARVTLSVHNSRKTAAAALGEYVSTIDLIPLQIKWKGSAPKSLDAEDYASRVRAAELAASEAVRDAMKRQRLQDDLAEIEARLVTLEPIDTATATNCLEIHKNLTKQLNLAHDEERQITLAHAKAYHAFNLVETNYNNALAAYEGSMAILASQKETLALYHKHNGLIRKLREARPVVAKQLWATVLHSVSHYFSQIRGIPSVVTKSDTGFLVDGKSATQLSGSTLDSLGLAVRISLQKTFLPSLDFMLLDEPASACDDGRETQMLGVLASSGYSQVVLVTHSDLADSFATQVVQI